MSRRQPSVTSGMKSLISVLRRDVPIDVGMKMLIKRIRNKRPRFNWLQFDEIDFEREETLVIRWITSLLALEKPPRNVEMFLFENVYIIGGSDLSAIGFNRTDFDERSGSYMPNDSMQHSVVLPFIFNACGGAIRKPDYFLMDTLSIGFIAFAIKHACSVIPASLWLGKAGSRKIFVASDDGPWIILGHMKRSGLELDPKLCGDGSTWDDDAK